MVQEKKAALLIIDMLNDFVKPGGTLVVPTAAAIIPNISQRREEARGNGEPVVYVCDTHHPNDSEFQQWPRHAVEGTWGAQVVDELKPSADDYVIPKRRFSAFFETSLDLLLRELNVGTIALTGTVTNICIYATALHGRMLGYEIIIYEDCVAGLAEEDHNFALKQMKEVLGAKIIS